MVISQHGQLGARYMMIVKFVEITNDIKKEKNTVKCEYVLDSYV